MIATSTIPALSRMNLSRLSTTSSNLLRVETSFLSCIFFRLLYDIEWVVNAEFVAEIIFQSAFLTPCQYLVKWPSDPGVHELLILIALLRHANQQHQAVRDYIDTQYSDKPIPAHTRLDTSDSASRTPSTSGSFSSSSDHSCSDTSYDGSKNDDSITDDSTDDSINSEKTLTLYQSHLPHVNLYNLPLLALTPHIFHLLLDNHYLHHLPAITPRYKMNKL